MKLMNRLSRMFGLWGLTLALMGGCASKDAARQDYFPASEAAAVGNVADAQMAAGAKADAMLRPMHFDGNQLNSLGKDKLNRIVEGAAGATVTIYLNVPQDSTVSARRDAVAAYLKQDGVKSNRIQIKDGANPQTYSPAAEGISRLSKTENPGANDKGTGSQGDATLAPTATMSGQ